MPFIHLDTPVPGPKSQALLERRRGAVSSALAQVNPIAVKRAHGSLIEDVDGNTLIDLAGGIGVMGVGHTPAGVVAAVQEQSAAYLHTCAIVTNDEPYVALAEMLNRLTPGSFPKKTLLANTGAEAVENAVKLARCFTNRAGVIVFEGAYHGRTNLTMAMTSKYGLFKRGFGPFAPEIYRLPLPNPYRPPEGMSAEAWTDWCCWNLDNALVAQIDPAALAAIVIEPVVGEGGFIPVPHKFLRRIREVCDRSGAVMIADEVQSGSGRTGRLWAIEHSGVVPDLLVSAKSLGAGLPISAVTGHAPILDAPHVGGVGSTYGGNPVGCVAALKVLELLQQPGFLAGAETVERVVHEVFDPLMEELPALGEVRGVGAMMAVEFVKDPVSKEPWPDLVAEAVSRAAQGGVVLIRAGLYSNCIRFLPALDIPEEMLREGLEVVKESVLEAHEHLLAVSA